ncbi:hypothetical protein MGALJ_19590 [Mycobacterium gallinarum]|uniref:Site-specific integrase n=1 Tax=Mycobacterium gallinarum TaxID=39689 RepID=A0A9W4FEQ0_9MYCO|nr:hypothetical protein MGALJ_19590 [Mycobacterium gallinarum]
MEDRWHRAARRGEAVMYPADASPSDAAWCIDKTHGAVGTKVCTRRHGRGQRWQARWVGGGHERSKSFAKKADAEAHVKQVTSDVFTGTYVDTARSAVTFGTVAEAWLKTKESANRAPKTIAGYRGLLDVTILPKWKDVPLRDIDHEKVQDWITWLSTDPAARQHKKKGKEDTGLSPARVIQVHQVLHQVLAYAVKPMKRISTNPADGTELPSKPASKGLALTHDQVRKLADAMVTAEANVRRRSDTRTAQVSPHALATMVRFLAYTGLRFGECAALRVGDVDTENRRIWVTKSITGVRGHGRIEGDTKTHQRRSVPILTTELAEELERVVTGRDPSEFLFPGPDGDAMTIGWFRVRFDRAVATLGIEGVTPHTLRHTAGSLAISEVGSVLTASKLLGHRNVSTTANVYSHMLEGDWDKLATAMDSAARKAANVEAR